MATWVALFRGINVGGRNVLPMKDLRSLLEGIGCARVQTYIQSGNAVFDFADAEPLDLARLISETVRNAQGFTPQVFLLTANELAEALAANPFQAAQANPKTLHLFFLNAHPEPANLMALGDIKSSSEEFRLKGKVFYLHAPDGVGRSKLAAKAEKILGVDVTARNWRTVSKLLEFLYER